MLPKHQSNGLCREELARKLAAAFISSKRGIPLEEALRRVPYNVDYYWLETADCVIEATAWLNLEAPRRY